MVKFFHISPRLISDCVFSKWMYVYLCLFLCLGGIRTMLSWMNVTILDSPLGEHFWITWFTNLVNIDFRYPKKERKKYFFIPAISPGHFLGDGETHFADIIMVYLLVTTSEKQNKSTRLVR